MAVLPDSVVDGTGGRIVLVVMDGLGGLPDPDSGRTELETARTPNLDRIAARSSLGLQQPVQPGISPGSGPGHLALFGYDPIRYDIGRGVLSALGVGFELRAGDVAVRLNLATLNGDGRVSDRRAGRPSDAENRRIVEKLRAAIPSIGGVTVFFEPEKEHRAVLVLRGRGLSAEVTDSDPQETDVPPLEVKARAPEAEDTARILQRVLDDARAALSDEPAANALLARGIDAYEPFPTLQERFQLHGVAIARYPMYSGVARLVGMDTCPPPESDAASVRLLTERLPQYDLVFIHFKAMDSRGEDGDFDAKVAAIEAVDALVPEIVAASPDVLVVTGDHSTPSRLRRHSWHPVPILIASPWTRPIPDASFGERACLRGELGIFPAVHVMTLALAHAGRLQKYGA